MARKKRNASIPQVPDFFIPILQTLLRLGDSGTIEEINEGVYEILDLSEEVLTISHGKDGRSEVEYRLAWARTVLKQYGILANSARGVWSITKGIDISTINPGEIVKAVRLKTKSSENHKLLDSVETGNIAIEVLNWKEKILEQLYEIKPVAFERLAQRLLRESGFVQVEVSGKTGDGGIDGKGIVRINGFLSFHVIFQCKRYKGSISASQIRDFRGAMMGRADKGLFITTGVFTRDALKEASRDGAPPIDLIDGEQLCDKLKELNLGVKIELVENVLVDEDWFKNL
ncbi:MAG: restriction endonuclease [Chitinophagales bacterium]|nr:restriction endonuclease [Chitinophagales bacterium]